MNLKSYLFILLISALISCSKDKTNTCTIIPSYDVEISSIINSYCIVCHQSGNAAGGINLENENFVEQHIDQIISEIETQYQELI